MERLIIFKHPTDPTIEYHVMLGDGWAKWWMLLLDHEGELVAWEVV